MQNDLSNSSRSARPPVGIFRRRFPALTPRVRTALVALVFLPLTAANHSLPAPQSLNDAEFWNLFTSMSEPGGSFVSENFVSNEVEFQHVIPSLQKSLGTVGAYFGVGPEQNFTYIANLHPRLAIIFDIRRQNAMQHLMYKALFELSPTRSEFVARLFSRPTVARLAPNVPVAELFDSATNAAASDSAFHANHDAILATLREKHHFNLAADDIATIENVYSVFHEAGPGITYATRSSMPAMLTSAYPTFGALQTATSADSVPMAFLASEERYRSVRDLELKNLIVPVVGDFAGPKAIRAVGEYLRKHSLTVSAFYVSNVEQYLFRQAQSAADFYGNVSSLPMDTTSVFIRSVPRGGGGLTFVTGSGIGNALVGPPGGINSGGYSISIVDVGGVRTTRTVRDSAGQQIVSVTVDSAGKTITRRGDSASVASVKQDSTYLASLRAMMATRDSLMRQFIPPFSGPNRMALMGGLLRSGVASMRETLDAFFASKLLSYDDVVRMTK